MEFTRRLFLGAAAIAAVSLFGVSADAAEKIKLAGVVPGSITDQAFNQVVYEGYVLARDTLGIEMAYTEKVKQADQAEVLEDYARRGYNVVIGAGGEFVEAVKRASKRYPDTLFACLNCALIEGAATINYDNHAIGYILGFVGGKMSDTKKLGIISGQKIKPAVDIAAGMRKGLKDATGGGEVLVTYTNDWDDVAKAKEAALGQISQGATAIVPYLDNGIVGVIQGLEQEGKYALSAITDIGKTKPETNLISTVQSWQQAVLTFVTLAAEGKAEAKDYLFSVGSKPLSVGTINPKVPAEVRAEVDKIVAKIKAGKFKM
jgi:basic membrane protein A